MSRSSVTQGASRLGALGFLAIALGCAALAAFGYRFVVPHVREHQTAIGLCAPLAPAVAPVVDAGNETCLHAGGH